jgi:hypothetical protein
LGRGVISWASAVAGSWISGENGVPQFAQNFASAEFCVPQRLQ